MMQNDQQLAPGDVVAGLETHELVEILNVRPFGGKTRSARLYDVIDDWLEDALLVRSIAKALTTKRPKEWNFSMHQGEGVCDGNRPAPT
jgi:hypothetical protein